MELSAPWFSVKAELVDPEEGEEGSSCTEQNCASQPAMSNKTTGKKRIKANCFTKNQM